MPETWPTDLPTRFSQDTYSEAIPDNLIRSQNDNGPANIRRRSTAVPIPVSGSMLMSSAQLETLVEFVNTTVMGGALPFTFPAHRGGDPWLVRFAEKGLPSWVPSGFDEDDEQAWDVNFGLEILP